ncbi:type I-E CRISPR-associated protein Cas6/Cse3/CasE [Hyphomicrobium sp. D-2]|uniref:type I-E CRISPR-associated protein Cas6/Cse3/CasE n=1 Tax=Hyphomicrobium sp. D-2 TaxID=3041621 RepID=UPI002456AFFF|nr:type I-E CRISPR-associated protein Cas6/Cse3/CasE [Hyphomicrobium sp. D-2]MDH4981168.1 type I-E CRISPR-associated protein Cas6/Cse3/CasE [Hyphomicrobium sp. D-2]
MTSAPPSLFMIEFKPDMQKATTWMLEQPRSIVRPGHDDGYGWHALLAAAFGDLAPKPFRLIERTRGTPQLLAYTQHDPSALVEQARVGASPTVYRAIGIDGIAFKPMPTKFHVGQRLGFEVRVRPTVRQDYRDPATGVVDRRRSRERDAFLAAVDAATLPRGERPEIVREEVYHHWLANRLNEAATIEPGSFHLAQLNRALLLRPKQTDRKSDPTQRRDLVRIGLLKSGTKGEQGGSPDATLQGTLTVADPQAFVALLGRGIGRHRAFGFGMLLLRPVIRR